MNFLVKPIANLMNILLTGLGVLYTAEHGVDRVDTFKETRFYRDWHELTPFHDVEVYYPLTFVSGRVIMMGEMRKRRCEFADLLGWATFEDSPKIRVIVDTSVEDARGVTGNRAPSQDALAWGPWALEWPEEKGLPDGWQIDAAHWCPVLDDDGNEIINEVTGEPRMAYQTNTFASGPWRSLAELEIEVNE